MAVRTTYSSGSAPPVTGVDFLDEYAARIKTLFDVSSLPLTAVGGTGNAVTATCDPPLTAGFLDGMKFTITWAAANSGAMTLAINGGAALAVLDCDGAAMVASTAISGRRSLIEYLGGVFRLIGGAGGAGGAGPVSQVFTASGTWTKPSGYDASTPVLIEAWGAGGGGGRNAGSGNPQGGSGGAYSSRLFKMSELPSSVAVAIGAGGAGATGTNDGGNGGNTTFGSLLTAYGGGGGASTGATGGGGGAISAGTATGAGMIGGGPSGASPDRFGGSAGGAAGAAGGAFMGGGGGGGGTAGPGAAPGTSVFGGSGGVGTSTGSAAAGLAPAGGGGGSLTGTTGAGARGEIRVWVIT